MLTQRVWGPAVVGAILALLLLWLATLNERSAAAEQAGVSLVE